MKRVQTSYHRTWVSLFSVFMLMLLGTRSSAQTLTTASCTNTYSYCTQDTVKLEPQDVVTYTNFQWYSMGAPDVLITAANGGTYNVDPTRMAVAGTIYVSAPGGTYILKAEYATPTGCATKNDTITINYLPIPDLVTTTDTICASAGNSADLTALVSDANSTTGSIFYYNTLAEAIAGGASTVTTPNSVEPTSTRKYYFRKNTAALDANSVACYDIDSVIIDVRCLNLGNYVWYDTNNDGNIDAGEAAIPGVAVQLFYDADGNGTLTGLEQTPIATDVTDGSGLYLFEGLQEGNYFVGIPATQFGSGQPLQHLYSSGTTVNNAGVASETAAPDPNFVSTDGDDNGQSQKTGFYAGGILTPSYVTLNYGQEPTGENPDNSTIADADDNLTVDFGFYGMSIGSNVFADVNNNGVQDPTEVGIANVMVILYAGNGTTPLDTVYTDASGNYIFTGLPEGNYVVGVNANDPDLDGQHSSTDVTSTATPESDDLDDNGVGTSGTGVILSTVITLDAGTEPGGPGLAGNNPLTPSTNVNNHVDFGFVPDCPTITNPSADQTICATESGSNITVNTSFNGANSVVFKRYTSAQTGNAMYTGGTTIGTVTPAGGAAPYTGTYTFSTSDFPNATTSPITYYVYAIMASPSSDPTCRPFQEIEVVVNPKPTATAASLEVCENTLGGGQGTFTLSGANTTVLGGQTGMTVTYHPTLLDANNDANALPNSYTANAGNVFVRVENAQGCYATATITLTVRSKPDFTLALATICPGNNPEVTISGLMNGDPTLSMTSVNGGTFNPYDASPPNITTADGLILNATNTITVRNQFGCETAKTIVVPNITPLVCPPVNVTVRRAGE
ncbi:MAG: hypothetical protein IPN76_06400 [Saprospiraceae bacterium]|nr:hypothetical protein [Saprospiraceae bacterium]